MGNQEDVGRVASPNRLSSTTEPVCAVSALSGFDPARWLRVIWRRIQVFVVLALLFSAVITAIHFAVYAAALFALGSETPPMPWFLWRMFLALGWMFAAIVALCSDSDRSGEAVETTGSTEGESAGPEDIAQPQSGDSHA